MLSSVSSISSVTEDYLTAVYKDEEWNDAASTGDLAAVLGVTASTVSSTLKRLAHEGYLDYQPYGRITLTAAGRKIALGVLRRRRIIETYLFEKLGLSQDVVHGEADVLEHAVSPLVLDAMYAAVGRPTHDPHGDPIPSENGEIPGEQGAAVPELAAGTAGTVARVRDGNPAVVRYLSSLGVHVGAQVEIVAHLPEVGTVSIRVDGTGRDIPVAVASAIRISPDEQADAGG
ncbi:metal-dependent transcriptional regulator [Dietzia sp.]|uniref:metal-dependent transcriptional regulator n=1 Tax=Dietzia sp. TaxID=1871616 RepID=UPI002FD97CFC